VGRISVSEAVVAASRIAPSSSEVDGLGIKIVRFWRICVVKRGVREDEG